METYTKVKNTIIEYTSLQEKHLKESSINAYLIAFKKLNTELFEIDRPKLHLLQQYKKITQFLDDKIPILSTRRNICSSVIIILKSNIHTNKFTTKSKERYTKVLKKYEEYYKLLSEQQQNVYIENEKNTKEETNWVTIEFIHELIKKLKDQIQKFKGTPRNYCDIYQMYLVLNLYTMLPPLRNDYANMKLISTKTEQNYETIYNYINLETHEIILLDYKTNKTYGLKTIEIPKELLEIIRDYLKVKKECNYINEETNTFLLINTKLGTRMTKNGLTKYLNRIFYPKKVSTTILRKVFVSEKYPVVHSKKERENDAYIMGHSVGVSETVYSKKL